MLLCYLKYLIGYQSRYFFLEDKAEFPPQLLHVPSYNLFFDGKRGESLRVGQGPFYI